MACGFCSANRSQETNFLRFSDHRPRIIHPSRFYLPERREPIGDSIWCSGGNAEPLATMMGSFFTRISLLILGYAYPAYECYKVVEMNKPEIERLLIWCQYWILVAVLTVFERIGDAFISWLPFYGELKVAFFVYLWHPKTKGTRYIYSAFFRPYMLKHELEIDRNLLELRARAVDFAAVYWQKTSSGGRAWLFGMLQFVVSQTSSSGVCPVEETRHAQHAAAESPHQSEQTVDSQQLKIEQTELAMSQKPEQIKLCTATDPFKEETMRQEQPTRIVRRFRIKKRVH